jgi:hypothetical protein
MSTLSETEARSLPPSVVMKDGRWRLYNAALAGDITRAVVAPETSTSHGAN